MSWSKPETQQIRRALREYAPQVADAPIAFLAEGWEFWAFTAGEYVLRFPKDESGLTWLLGTKDNFQTLRLEQALLPELSSRVSTRVPKVEFVGEHGPNGAPFAAHRILPGEVLITSGRRPSANFGKDIGRFINELHSFPVRRAIELGVPLLEGAALREQRAAHYEDVIRRLFPLVSCEARTQIEAVYEANLNNVANFEFEPCLVHQDLDCNTLIDAAGDLCGVIDFGDAVVSNPALDFWLPLFGFGRLGLEDQLGACLQAAGVDERRLQAMRPEVEFLDFRFPLLDILHGVDISDDTFVEEGIRALNASLPSNIRC